MQRKKERKDRDEERKRELQEMHIRLLVQSVVLHWHTTSLEKQFGQVYNDIFTDIKEKYGEGSDEMHLFLLECKEKLCLHLRCSLRSQNFMSLRLVDASKLLSFFTQDL